MNYSEPFLSGTTDWLAGVGFGGECYFRLT